MKLAFIGCCFRIELEFFRPEPLDLSQRPFVRGEHSFALRRQLLRQTISKVKSTPARVASETELSSL